MQAGSKLQGQSEMERRALQGAEAQSAEATYLAALQRQTDIERGMVGLEAEEKSGQVAAQAAYDAAKSDATRRADALKNQSYSDFASGLTSVLSVGMTKAAEKKKDEAYSDIRAKEDIEPSRGGRAPSAQRYREAIPPGIQPQGSIPPGIQPQADIPPGIQPQGSIPPGIQPQGQEDPWGRAPQQAVAMYSDKRLKASDREALQLGRRAQANRYDREDSDKARAARAEQVNQTGWWDQPRQARSAPSTEMTGAEMAEDRAFFARQEQQQQQPQRGIGYIQAIENRPASGGRDWYGEATAAQRAEPEAAWQEPSPWDAMMYSDERLKVGSTMATDDEVEALRQRVADRDTAMRSRYLAGKHKGRDDKAELVARDLDQYVSDRDWDKPSGELEHELNRLDRQSGMALEAREGASPEVGRGLFGDVDDGDVAGQYDELLRSMRPYKYRYTPEAQQRLDQPSGPQAGIMAQDVEQSQIGRDQIVRDTPEGKVIDERGAQMATLGAVGRLGQRMDELEAERARELASYSGNPEMGGGY
jgi:hypothetical protein